MSNENCSLLHQKFKTVTAQPIERDALSTEWSVCLSGLHRKGVA